jgi:hypothetical protein
MNQIARRGHFSQVALLVLSAALGSWAPTVLAADKSGDAKAHMQVRQQCEKRMKAIVTLQEKLKALSGAELQKYSDPRLAQRLTVWEKISAEFTAKLSTDTVGEDDLQEYLKAYDRTYSMARWIRLRMLGVDRLLAVRRSPVRSGHVYEYHNPRFEKGGSPGGGIYECLPGPDGYKMRRIVDAGRGLIARCDLSFDAREILLNWKKPGKHFQVYRVGVDGKGLKQLTSGDWDNYDSCWLPVGDVVFISNRDMQWALCLWTPMGVMYRMDRNGGAQRRISANYLQDFTPSVTSDGRIMFSRWEYVDRPVQPTKGIWTMEPDGSMMRGYYGNRVLSPKAFVDARSIPGSRRVICTLAGHLGWLNGALGAIDPTLGDNTQAAITSLTPECDTGKVDQYRAGSDFLGRYETPYPIDGKHYLFSHNGLVMLRDFAGTEEWLILDRKDGKGFYSARPLRARATPPVRRSMLDSRAGKWAEIIVQDVYQGLLPHVARGQVKQICVVQELPKAGPRNQLRQTALDGHQFSVVSGHGTFAAKKVCGYANVATDGSAYFKAPTDVPIYFMAIDAEGRAVQRMRTWTQFRPGEKHSCIGCHESRLAAPRPGRRPAATAGGVRNLKPPDWGLQGFSYPTVVQPIWDRYCLRCHDGVKEPRNIDFCGVQTTYFSKSYDLLVPWRWARNADKYHKTYGRKPYVNWIPTTSWSGSEGFVREITPNKWGSPASSLTKLILSGHPDKNGKKRFKMDDKSRRRVFAWIDLNVPFYGSYRGPTYQDPETLRRRKEMLSKINGWSKTLVYGGRAQYGSFVGRMTKDYARCSRGQKEVVWLTQAVPENLPTKGNYTFSWIAALGWISQPKTEFQLFLEGKPLLKFTVTHDETVWKSPDGAVKLRFIPVSAEGGGLDRVGFMELTVPTRMLKGGQKTKLRVVAPQTGSHRWFGIYHYPAAGTR